MQTESKAPNHLLPRFRQDLSINKKPWGEQGKTFEITDPVSGEQYELDAQTFFLFQSFDGFTSADQIVSKFNNFFDNSITTEELSQFFEQALEIGLLDNVDPSTIAAFRSGFSNGRSRPARGYDASNTDGDDDPWDEDSDKTNRYRWTLFDPSKTFALVNRTVKPFRLLFLFLVYELFLGVPVALITFFDNQHLMSQDLAQLGESRSYFGRLIFSLFLINLLRCVIQGTLIAYYGGTAKTFGIRLRFSIIPRFFVDKSAIKNFDRNAKLWTYGSNLLFRLILIVLGVLIWYLFRGTGTQLAVNAIIITHSALISLILVSLPLRASDGYRWLMTFLRLPLTLMKLAILTFTSKVTRRPFPTSISEREQRRLFVYALALIGFWTYAFFRISSHIAAGLITSFPMIFGEATEVVITTLVVLLILRWGFYKFAKVRVGGNTDRLANADFDPSHKSVPAESLKPHNIWLKRGIRLLVLAAFVGVLVLPYPYRPGGEISLLPPEQQAIQAPVSGKVIEVLHKGGDGQLLPAMTPIATMVSSDLENLILTLQEQVTEQKAELQKQRALLDKLLAGPRNEEVEQAQARVEEAAEEVKLAERQLETAKVTWIYSDKELKRIRQLPGGLISELEIARAEKQAEVDRLRIKEHESNLAAKKKSVEEAKAQLALLLSGTTKEDIEVARQEVARAEAELRRLGKELAYAQSQVLSSRLTIPFDGYLVDSYLNQKIGSYLTRGETYAIAQTHHNPMVQMVLPEYDVAEIQVGSVAKIKLMAYPSQPLQGEVVSIEPAGSEEVFGQTFKVVIELAEIPNPVKPGMSGYGKIEAGTKPLFVLLTRPLVRFVQIEMWSWIP
jgi:putative peptide zinc metalloprotease protein